MGGQFDSQVDPCIACAESNASAPGSKKGGTWEIPISALNQGFSIEETCMRFSNTLWVISGTASVKLPSAKYHRASLMVNTGSGNGLLTSGGKPLPEPRLTQSSVTIWCLYATLSWYPSWFNTFSGRKYSSQNKCVTEVLYPELMLPFGTCRYVLQHE